MTIEEFAQDTEVSSAQTVNQNLCELLTENGEWEAPWFSCTTEELKILLKRNIVFSSDRMRS